MACSVIHHWSFSTLVGAFLDLGLSYLLLCCSALSFFAAKFLGLLGFHLPCPCNGLFGDPDGTKCIQRFLVEVPSRKISSVQMSIRSRFPFDSIMAGNDAAASGRHLNVVKFVARNSGSDAGFVEIERGEESCSSLEAQNSRSLTVCSGSPLSKDVQSRSGGAVNSHSARRGRFDGRGKGISHQKLPPGLLRRRRAAGVSAISSSSETATTSPNMTGERGKDICKENWLPLNSGGDRLQYDTVEGSNRTSLVEGTLPVIKSNGPPNEAKVTDKDESFIEGLVPTACNGVLRVDGNETNAITMLEQALKEEHAARTALYYELEKERSAAASAADEAMAMIMRLQEEKAMIEMEARQYQRLIEEKSAYDGEEMSILKEILVRREKEKHFLEKEVEFCRQMMRSGGRSQLSEDDLHDAADMSGQRPYSSFDSVDDPAMLMLQELSESLRKKEREKEMNKSSGDGPFVANQSTSRADRKESQSLDGVEDIDFIKRGGMQRKKSTFESYLHEQGYAVEGNLEFQEKDMVTLDDVPSYVHSEEVRLDSDSILLKLDGPKHDDFCDETFLFADEGHGQKDDPGICEETIAQKSDSAHGGVDFQASRFDMELRVHDVHVVDDKHDICNCLSGDGSKRLWVGTAPESSNKNDIPVESSGIRKMDALIGHLSSKREEPVEDIHRSGSDVTAGLLPLDSSESGVLFSDSQRASLSEVDIERLKLEKEVGQLTKRLRVVREGREKLNISMEHREREKFQLQLLEEIASQLQEIRSLTQSGKAARQASLPPSSSKAYSKKRRCRSVSWGVREST